MAHAQRTFAELFPPGEFLRDELSARGWTQTEFAEIIGRPARLVNEIIAGKKSITPETAQAFGAAFGMSPQYWMNLETSYQLFKTAQAQTIATDTISRKALLRSNYPVRDMIKRGWIEDSENHDVLEQRILDFFVIKSMQEKPQFGSYAAKRNHGEELSNIQLAWLFRVQQIAKSISVPNYSEKALKSSLSKLQELMMAPDEARHVPRIMMECGVRFILVEPFPGSKIDGVCFWLNKTSPVIAMSMRRDQIDNFWFVLRHEIEHVLNKDGQDGNAVVDTNLEGKNLGTDSSLPKEERLANAAAADFCVSTQKMDSFMARKKPFYYEKDVAAFAKLMNRHIGIVVGQMQFRMDRYDYLKRHLVKIRQFVLPGAIADGWGQTVPID